MYKNYIIIAARNFWKNKVLSTINIVGLSIGISASLVIYLLVNYHLTFDQFEKEKDQIYRVVSNFSFSGEIYHNSGVADPMGAAVRKDLTGLEKVICFRTMDGDVKITVPGPEESKETLFKKQNKIVFADSNYFKLIGYEWIAGSADISLNEPYQVVLTAENANLYFPGLSATEVVGKKMVINDTIIVNITGVVKDIKQNTDFTFKTFIAYSTLERTSLKPENWAQWNSTNGAQQLWLKLLPQAGVKQIEKQLAQLYNKNNKREAGDNSKTWHTLQPLHDLHFNADYGNYEYELTPAHMPTLYGLTAVAIFLLLLGCINFINLTTARASQRAKEIGIRKTIGSSRKQLVLQFFSETFLFTLAATIISIALLPLILKAFSGFMPQKLNFDQAFRPGVIIFLPALLIFVTLLSGFYPAAILSGYKPVSVLKNQAYANTGKTRNAWLRKSLTVSQFVIAQVFVMAAILVSKQITFSLNRDLGFKKEAILYMSTNYYDTVQSHKYNLLNKLKAIPEVAMVSLSSNPPSSNSTWSGTMKYKDGKKEIETDVQQKFGDTNYIKLYQLKLLAGANIRQTDTVNSFLINETYARILGFKDPQQALGKFVEWSNKQIPIVGVVADFHQKSLHETIKPLVIGNWQNSQTVINIALMPQDQRHTVWKNALAKIENSWKEIYPQDDFEYKFFDEDIAKFYDQEKNISRLLMWATGLAIFISCLGLLGIVMYTTTQRTKEIGVRKILGASVAQIVTMISADFIWLILIAFIIAAPLAAIGMYKWLENFAYRTGISWWIFLLGGSIMVVVALITLSFETIKAAVANPVKSLRTE